MPDPSTPPSGQLHQSEGAAIAALTGSHPTEALASLPADFADRFGYRPVVLSGAPANPYGGCSSPIPMPAQFENLCKTHDLGYDLLRSATAHGHPLSGWARERLDSSLVDRMYATCHDPGCTTAAGLAESALAVNTWRQHAGNPGPETAAQIASSMLERSLGIDS